MREKIAKLLCDQQMGEGYWDRFADDEAKDRCREDSAQLIEAIVQEIEAMPNPYEDIAFLEKLQREAVYLFRQAIISKLRGGA